MLHQLAAVLARWGGGGPTHPSVSDVCTAKVCRHDISGPEDLVLLSVPLEAFVGAVHAGVAQHQRLPFSLYACVAARTLLHKLERLCACDLKKKHFSQGSKNCLTFAGLSSLKNSECSNC